MEWTQGIFCANFGRIYYGRACDPCVLPAVNEIATEQASPTTDTITRTEMLMVDYLHIYPSNAILCYYDSDMILKITADPKHKVVQQYTTTLFGQRPQWHC
jgi:hypothetical protein